MLTLGVSLEKETSIQTWPPLPHLFVIITQEKVLCCVDGVPLDEDSCQLQVELVQPVHLSNVNCLANLRTVETYLEERWDGLHVQKYILSTIHPCAYMHNILGGGGGGGFRICKQYSVQVAKLHYNMVPWHSPTSSKWGRRGPILYTCIYKC